MERVRVHYPNGRPGARAKTFAAAVCVRWWRHAGLTDAETAEMLVQVHGIKRSSDRLMRAESALQTFEELDGPIAHHLPGRFGEWASAKPLPPAQRRREQRERQATTDLLRAMHEAGDGYRQDSTVARTNAALLRVQRRTGSAPDRGVDEDQVSRFNCPTCGAKLDQRCRGTADGSSHPGRRKRAAKASGTKRHKVGEMQAEIDRAKAIEKRTAWDTDEQTDRRARQRESEISTMAIVTKMSTSRPAGWPTCMDPAGRRCGAGRNLDDERARILGLPRLEPIGRGRDEWRAWLAAQASWECAWVDDFAHVQSYRDVLGDERWCAADEGLVAVSWDRLYDAEIARAQAEDDDSTEEVLLTGAHARNLSPLVRARCASGQSAPTHRPDAIESLWERTPADTYRRWPAWPARIPMKPFGAPVRGSAAARLLGRATRLAARDARAIGTEKRFGVPPKTAVGWGPYVPSVTPGEMDRLAPGWRARSSSWPPLRPMSDALVADFFCLPWPDVELTAVAVSA